MNKFLAVGFCFLLGIVAMGAGTVVNTPGVPAGAIMAFGGSGCPQGWLLANGAARSSAGFPALDAYFGTTWGARSGGNFQTPDLNTSGRYLRGGVAGTLQAQATAKNGLSVPTPTVSSLTAAAQSWSGSSGSGGIDHSHPLTAGGVAYFAVAGNGWNSGLGGGNATLSLSNGYNSGTNTQSMAHTHSVSGSNGTSSVTGTLAQGAITGDTETRPITAVVLYCIKY